MGGQYAFEKTKNTANILALYGPPFALSTTKRYYIVFTRLIPSFYKIFFINRPDDHKMINAFANSILESYNENTDKDRRTGTENTETSKEDHSFGENLPTIVAAQAAIKG
jgi:hypothetical protein